MTSVWCILGDDKNEYNKLFIPAYNSQYMAWLIMAISFFNSTYSFKILFEQFIGHTNTTRLSYYLYILLYSV